MSEPIVIQSDGEHGKLLEEAAWLAHQAPALGTPESDRLLAIAAAAEVWEAKLGYCVQTGLTQEDWDNFKP